MKNHKATENRSNSEATAAQGLDLENFTLDDLDIDFKDADFSFLDDLKITDEDLDLPDFSSEEFDCFDVFKDKEIEKEIDELLKPRTARKQAEN